MLFLCSVPPCKNVCFGVVQGLLLPHEVKAVLQAQHRPNYVLQVRWEPGCGSLGSWGVKGGPRGLRAQMAARKVPLEPLAPSTVTSGKLIPHCIISLHLCYICNAQTCKAEVNWLEGAGLA